VAGSCHQANSWRGTGALRRKAQARRRRTMRRRRWRARSAAAHILHPWRPLTAEKWRRKPGIRCARPTERGEGSGMTLFSKQRARRKAKRRRHNAARRVGSDQAYPARRTANDKRRSAGRKKRQRKRRSGGMAISSGGRRGALAKRHPAHKETKRPGRRRCAASTLRLMALDLGAEDILSWALWRKRLSQAKAAEGSAIRSGAIVEGAATALRGVYAAPWAPGAAEIGGGRHRGILCGA